MLNVLDSPGSKACSMMSEQAASTAQTRAAPPSSGRLAAAATSRVYARAMPRSAGSFGSSSRARTVPIVVPHLRALPYPKPWGDGQIIKRDDQLAEVRAVEHARGGVGQAREGKGRAGLEEYARDLV